MSKKRTSIKDIAKAVGVSPSTVSRVLNPNQNAKISQGIIDRVKKKVDEMGYVSDITASGLRKNETKTIGLVIPDILNPFFATIIKGAQDYLAQFGYVTFIVTSNNDPILASEEVKKLIARRVDGIIFVSAFLQDESVNLCLNRDIPIVLVNRVIENHHDVHMITNNDEEGIRLAVSHLIDLGHENIIHLAGPTTISQGAVRKNAFIQACQQSGIRFDVISLNAFSFNEGVRGIDKLFQQRLTGRAIIAGNDMIAMGAMHALQEKGYNVPKAYSVVGFNNMPLSDMVHPPLTTVAVPQSLLGEQAAKILIESMLQPSLEKQHITLSPTLEIRQSTAQKR